MPARTGARDDGKPEPGRTPREHGPDQRLVEHALTLIARAHGGDAQEAAGAQVALDAWRRETLEHETAYREADVCWRAVGGAAASLREEIAEPAMAAPLRRRGRRIARAGTALLIIIMLGLVVRWYVNPADLDRRYRASTAEVARVELPDGSQIDLAARSTVQVRYDRSSRRIEFEGGEARFEVTGDPARPFVVATRVATVTVTGTTFAVSDRGGAVVVSVELGRVAVAFGPTDLGATALSTGERVTISGGRTSPIERIDPRGIAPWRTGWLVYDNTPLGEAILSINAYLPAPLSVVDARAAGQRLTGSFRTNAPDAILDALPRILPVEIRRTPAGGREIISRR